MKELVTLGTYTTGSLLSFYRKCKNHAPNENAKQMFTYKATTTFISLIGNDAMAIRSGYSLELGINADNLWKS